MFVYLVVYLFGFRFSLVIDGFKLKFAAYRPAPQEDEVNFYSAAAVVPELQPDHAALSAWYRKVEAQADPLPSVEVDEELFATFVKEYGPAYVSRPPYPSFNGRAGSWNHEDGAIFE